MRRKALRALGLSVLLALSLAGCGGWQPATQAGRGEVEREVVRQVATASSDNPLVQSFAQPESQYRPLTRWWVPGSQMDKAEVKHEIESMVEAGFGGAEVVPVSIAGGDGEGEIDWGSDNWKEITKYMLEVAGENDFTIDFTMTPAWPLALPGITDVDDPAQGAQMELDGAHVDREGKAGKEAVVVLPENQESIDDAAAVDGTVELVGVTVARYADDGKTLLFDSAQALDLASVSNDDDGSTVTFTPEEDGTYLVYAWYQHPSGNTKYGNIQLDHFSRAATDALTSYWEANLIPYYGEDWKSVRSLFIDSLEFETQADWTYGIQDEFQARFGYDITPYLPAIYDEGGAWEDGNWGATGNYMGEPIPEFAFDRNSSQVLNDWRECLTQLYGERHVQPIAAWCEGQGVTLRYQTAYGKDLEVAQTALYPDVPETESLYGDDHMDFYRLQAGAVHAMDRPVYSMETAAEWTETWNAKGDDGEYGTRGNGERNSGNYEQTFLDHLWHDQRAFATGVNQVVFHGYPYSGAYDGGAVEGTQWPGFTGFESYRWSNSWGERQPNWIFSPTYLDYVTRSQYILRQGTPKVDVAVYRHSYYEVIDFWDPGKLFDTEALEQSGYSYDFVAPATLELGNMTVTDGVLDPDGTSYRALVIDQEDELPSYVVARLNEYASAGLEIVFVGEPASSSPSMVDGDDVSMGMEVLLTYDNVVTVADEDAVLGALRQAGVVPAASYDGEYLLANHRSADGQEIYYLYNYANTNSYHEIHDAEAVDADVTLKGADAPYLFDAWTGRVSAIDDYEQGEGAVTVHVHIAPNDTAIIVLSDEQLVEPAEGAEPMAGEVELDGWDLSVASWVEGETVLDIVQETIAVGTLDDLVTWDRIAGLEGVSGVGTYTATFELPEGYRQGQGAYVHMGHVRDAFGIRVNGQDVVVNQASGDADITDVLVEGENTIEVRVATSMLNAVLESNSDILNDDGRVLDDRSPSAYGLAETVTIDGNATR